MIIEPPKGGSWEKPDTKRKLCLSIWARHVVGSLDMYPNSISKRVAPVRRDFPASPERVPRERPRRMPGRPVPKRPRRETPRKYPAPRPVPLPTPPKRPVPPPPSRPMPSPPQRFIPGPAPAAPPAKAPQVGLPTVYKRDFGADLRKLNPYRLAFDIGWAIGEQLGNLSLQNRAIIYEPDQPGKVAVEYPVGSPWEQYSWGNSAPGVFWGPFRGVGVTGLHYPSALPARPWPVEASIGMQAGINVGTPASISGQRLGVFDVFRPSGVPIANNRAWHVASFVRTTTGATPASLFPKIIRPGDLIQSWQAAWPVDPFAPEWPWWLEPLINPGPALTPQPRPIRNPAPRPRPDSPQVPEVGPAPVPAARPATRPNELPGPLSPALPPAVRDNNNRVIVTPGLPPVVKPGTGPTQPPGKGRKEGKARLGRIASFIWNAFNPITETIDFIDNLYEALPKSLKVREYKKLGRQPNPVERVKLIYENFASLDLEKALTGYVKMQLTDALYAFGSRQVGAASRQDNRPIGYEAGGGLSGGRLSPDTGSLGRPPDWWPDWAPW